MGGILNIAKAESNRLNRLNTDTKTKGCCPEDQTGAGNGIYSGSGDIPEGNNFATITDNFLFVDQAGTSFLSLGSDAFAVDNLWGIRKNIDDLTGHYAIFSSLFNGTNEIIGMSIQEDTSSEATAYVIGNYNPSNNATEVSILSRNGTTGAGTPSLFVVAIDQQSDNGLVAFGTMDNLGNRYGVTVDKNGVSIGDPIAGTNYIFPHTKGANNQILVTDGSGVVTWQNQSGSSPTYTVVQTIDYNIVNTQPATATVDYISAGILANEIVKEAYIDVTTAFVSATRGIDEVLVSLSEPGLPVDEKICEVKSFGTIANVGGRQLYLRYPEIGYQINHGIPKSTKTTITFDAGVNPKDYTAGEMKIVFVIEPFPSI